MCEFLVHNYVILAVFRPPNGDVESNTKADIIHQCMTYAINCMMCAIKCAYIHVYLFKHLPVYTSFVPRPCHDLGMRLSTLNY